MPVTLEPARWPGGPLICPAVNLPSFPTQGDAADFLGKLCGVALVKWHCKECGGWHFWAKPFAPAGESSGTARVYHVPYHVLKLIRETRHLAPERERAQPLSIPLNTRVNYDDPGPPEFQRRIPNRPPARKPHELGHPLKREEIQAPPESTVPDVPTVQYLSTGQSKLPWDDPSFIKWAKHENR